MANMKPGFLLAMALCAILAIGVTFLAGSEAQTVPPGATMMTVNQLATLRGAIEDLERGNCKGVPRPAQGAPDARTCEPFKNLPYVTLALDLARIDEVLQAYRKGVQDLNQRVFGPNGMSRPLEKDATPAQRQEYDRKLNEFNVAAQLMADAPHSITLEHLDFAKMDVGDPPKNGISPSDLAVLSESIMDGMTAPIKTSATAEHASEPKK